MGRPPLAKEKILAAARQIVERDGAGALTFDELARESGITRGGITYHFPTKEDLLRGLLEADFLQWDVAEAALTPSDCDPETARLLGFIRTLTAQDESGIIPKYCTYWLESMWSGAKYTAVKGIPSPVICSTHCGNSTGSSSTWSRVREAA